MARTISYCTLKYELSLIFCRRKSEENIIFQFLQQMKPKQTFLHGSSSGKIVNKSIKQLYISFSIKLYWMLHIACCIHNLIYSGQRLIWHSIWMLSHLDAFIPNSERYNTAQSILISNRLYNIWTNIYVIRANIANHTFNCTNFKVWHNKKQDAKIRSASRLRGLPGWHCASRKRTDN